MDDLLRKLQHLIDELHALIRSLSQGHAPSANDLPAPIVPEAVNDRIDPTDVTAVHIRVPSGADIQPSDTVLFDWKAPSVDGSWTQSFNNLRPGDQVLVDKEVRLPNLGTSIAVTYGRLRNSQYTPSATYDVRMGSIHDDADGLPRPEIREASGDILNLGTLQGDAHAELAVSSLFAPDQRFRLSLTGVDEQNHAVSIELVNGQRFGPLSPDPMSLATAPRNWLDNLQDASTLTLTAWVAFDGSSEKSSAIRLRRRELTMKAPKAPSLVAPAVSAAEGPNKDTLRPEALIAKQAITVYISSRNDFQAGDTLTLHWDDGTSEGSRSVDMNPARAGGDVYVGKDVIAHNLGHSVKVYFTVHRDGLDYDSPTLNLQVQRIPNDSTDWPRLIVTEGPDKDLDLTKFTGAAHLTIEPFHFIELGQRYWIEVSGMISGNRKTEIIANGREFTSIGGPTIPLGQIDRKWLDTLDDASQLWINAWVTFDGSLDKSKAVQFRQTRLVVHAKAFVEDFNSLTPLYPNMLPIPFQLPHVTISGGTAQATRVDQGPMQGVALYLQKSTEIDLRESRRQVEFDMYAVSNPSVTLLRANKSQLTTLPLATGGRRRFTYSAPDGDTFRYLLFQAESTIIDNLSCR